MTPISQQRFDALAGYARLRSPIPLIEVAWFSHQGERLVGTVVLDGIDGDFSFVAMGRDRIGRFRGVKFGINQTDPDAAVRMLRGAFEEAASEADDEFHQGDEPRTATRLLTPLVAPERQNSTFRALATDERWVPARGIIGAMSPYYDDVDGNFVEQFQTTAFDARVWELYLFAAFHEMGFAFTREHAAPDLHAVSPFGELFVEAVTVNATASGTVGALAAPGLDDPAFLRDYMPIKWGSSLFSKLQKRYWEQPHVAGRPLILAVQDFHAPLSMMRTRSALPRYLYGVEHVPSRGDRGELVITPRPIERHTYGTKSIPSGFFNLPGAENISAVVHNPHGTATKFNRMGVLAGFGGEDLEMVRTGLAHDPDPDAAEPRPFRVDVMEEHYRETWCEGMTVFHNPRALVPIDPDLMPVELGVVHSVLRDDLQIEATMPPFFPYMSTTRVRARRPARTVH